MKLENAIRKRIKELSEKNNITILMGDSGTGKSAIFSFIRECAIANPKIMCFNYLDYQKNIIELIGKAEGNLIVIDNADILIDDDIRKFINFEFSNQYMLFLRNCDGLNVSDKSFKVLHFDDNKITLEEEL